MRGALILAGLIGLAAAGPLPTMTPDIPKSYTAPTDRQDVELREVMIPMRDGVKLNTVIIVPKGIKNAPIIFVRTPYNAAEAAEKTSLRRDIANRCGIDPMLDGYICAIQDVRGKYGSEGDYVMTRPLRGPINDTATDHATDSRDSVDWLVKNVPETNGRVGLTGGSYVGYTVLMGTIDPHPAVKVAVAISPMVDGWIGDDWFQNGAFRQNSYDFVSEQNSVKGSGDVPLRSEADDYAEFLAAGSANAYAKSRFGGQLPFAVKLAEHPNYDAWWQGQAVDRLLAARPISVPLMIVTSQWDQEDIYGGQAVWKALKDKPDAAGRLFLVMGPWHHSQMIRNGSTLGALKFPNDTSLAFRRTYLKPFFDHHLKGAPDPKQPRVLTYATGPDVWRHLDQWPLSCASGCQQASQNWYLGGDGSLGPVPSSARSVVSYVSDPARPVPYVKRPISFGDGAAWSPWLVTDQRHVGDRTDVVSFTSPVLDKPVHIAGETIAKLVAATTGTDGDFVVKLIDVYPGQYPQNPEMAGYQLGIAMEIFRGRFRESFETPKPVQANKPLLYSFALPHADHVFLPGHRIMVQIQSTWFPLYDRNPQTFVPNIFDAKPGDYKAATISVETGGRQQSLIELPVVR